MKQYWDSIKIADGKLVVNGDPRNVLLGKVSEEELEQYQQRLEQEGIGDNIDWQGVESDFKKMEVNFDNAGYLNTKIDYSDAQQRVPFPQGRNNKGGILNECVNDSDSHRKTICRKLECPGKEKHFLTAQRFRPAARTYQSI
ncbi:hypothetical protein VSQ48_09645 [Candidatus Ventrimonas sp. KK005]